MVLTALGFVISLSLLNVDAFIVEQNIQREIRSVNDDDFSRGRADLDAQYFLDLSDDAIPSLVDAYRSKSLPASVKEKVGASLACIRYKRNLMDRDQTWQSFHLSRYSADRAFEAVSKELDAYQVEDEDLPAVVITHAGEEFSCWQYYYD
jgi:hypothetical protein